MTREVYDRCIFLRNVAFFEGHLTIAFMFTFSGIWWVYNILRNYHKCRMLSSQKFQSQLWYIGPCTKRFPLETFIKLFVFGFQIGFYVLACPIFKLPCTFSIHGQHAYMFLVFTITGIVESMLFFKFQLPENADRAMYVFSFLVTGFLFYFHGGHMSSLNDAMHLNVLPWLCVAVSCSYVWESYDPTSVMVAIVRPFLVTVFGTWFFQLGYMLYPVFAWQKDADGEDHLNVVNVPMLFAFHLVGVIFLFLFINLWTTSSRQRARVQFPQYNFKEKCCKCEALLSDNCKMHLSE